MLIILCATLLPLAASHGMMTWPPSRQNGSLANAGRCHGDSCMWFTQPTSIPGNPSLPQSMRSFNVDVHTGDAADWSAKMPWRAPGTAPVSGSGCGILGGNTVPLPNGGIVDPESQAFDGRFLAPTAATTWQRGSIQEVGFSMTANHGGGYSYRLCAIAENGYVNEECFQRTQLKFAGDTHTIRHDNQSYQYDKMVRLPSYEIPRHSTTEGTWPRGSEWARVPLPACRLCDQSVCGRMLLPNLTDHFRFPAHQLAPGGGSYRGMGYGGLPWFKQQMCAQSCSGLNLTACPPGMLQFEEPANGLSGYTMMADQNEGFPFSIMDKVQVPEDLAPGSYLLSWRWDCEQSHQIWQNCADIRITT